MLFALYASIQALTQADADRAARLQLTGIYHTLLRLWAETGPTTHHDLPQRDLPAALVLRHHRRHRARHRRRHRRHPQLRGRTAEGTEPRGDDGPAARRAPGPGRTGGSGPSATARPRRVVPAILGLPPGSGGGRLSPAG